MRGLKKTTAKEKKETIAKNILVVHAAIKAGATTKSDISKLANIPIWRISETFKEDSELYGMYLLVRKELVDIASDNISDIIKDKNHPQHFAASKFVLQNYKSELDESLDSKDGESIDSFSIKVGKKSKGSPVKITFSNSKDDEK